METITLEKTKKEEEIDKELLAIKETFEKYFNIVKEIKELINNNN